MIAVRRALLVFSTVGVSLLVGLGAVGYLLFTRPHVDPLSKADAIVVLGGEDDGRIGYGLDLARQGYADTVVLSSGILDQHPEYHRACNLPSPPGPTVICFDPDPWTTRGEAQFVQRKAAEFGWRRVIVISWNFHMVRARYIFGQCFDGTTIMRPVPRSYDFGLRQWARVYAYQYGALVKAAVLGC